MENTYDNVLSAARARMVEAGRVNHLSRTLMSASVGLRRKPFDPRSAEDRLQYAHFMAKGAWKDGKSFYCEWPHASVPDTVREKLLNHFLRQELARIDGSNVVRMRAEAERAGSEGLQARAA